MDSHLRIEIICFSYYLLTRRNLLYAFTNDVFAMIFGRKLRQRKFNSTFSIHVSKNYSGVSRYSNSLHLPCRTLQCLLNILLIRHIYKHKHKYTYFSSEGYRKKSVSLKFRLTKQILRERNTTYVPMYVLH